MNKRLEEFRDAAAAENASTPIIALDNVANTFRSERESDFIKGANWMHAELMPRVQKLVEALALGDSTTYPDPTYQREVNRLGERIGFGALMHAANYGWQQALKEKGHPSGSEFVFGPCKITRDTALTEWREFMGEG